MIKSVHEIVEELKSTYTVKVNIHKSYIYMEQKLRFGMVLGWLAILKNGQLLVFLGVIFSCFHKHFIQE